MAFYIKNKEGQILTSGGYLEVGEGLRVEEGALKANEGIDIDAELKTDSTNPVQNQVITQRLQEIDLVTAAALNDLNDKKVDRSELETVAFTGDYNDLENKPEVEQSDWNENDQSSPAFIKNKPEKLGGIDNIEINGIPGESKEVDEQIVAAVELTGLDVPVGEDFVESTATNEDLEISAADDTVSDALGKLQKALKDDEAAITRAFLAVENATGFNNNLEYIKEPAGTILGDDENVNNLQTADAKLQSKISENILKLNLHEANTLKFVTAGTNTSGTKTTTFSVGDKSATDQGYTHVIELPRQVIFNVTADYPLSSGYYSISGGDHPITSADAANNLYTTSPVRSGCIFTFQSSEHTWEAYQYIGPDVDGRISLNGWTNVSNWFRLWITANT